MTHSDYDDQKSDSLKLFTATAKLLRSCCGFFSFGLFVTYCDVMTVAAGVNITVYTSQKRTNSNKKTKKKNVQEEEKKY